MRTQLSENGSRELRRAVRERTKELDRVEEVVIPSWRTTLKASSSRAEVEETVKLVKSKGKQMVFPLQVKGKDRQPFWVKAMVDTWAQASLIRTGLARDLVKPSKRPLRLVPANGEVLGGGDKEVELMILSCKEMQK